MHIGDGVDDPRVDVSDVLLAVEGGVRMGDVVPDDVVGIGGERVLDAVGVLGGKVTIDDVDG
jgi:hypothetical protein